MAVNKSTDQGEQDLIPDLKDEKLIVVPASIPELPEEPLLDADADVRQSLSEPEVDSILKREEI